MKLLNAEKEAIEDDMRARDSDLAGNTEDGMWVPASGGTERPFMSRGYRLQYLWQPSTGRHAYINCDTDILLTDAEVREIFLR